MYALAETILQYHGKGVNPFQCDVRSHMNGYWADFIIRSFAVTDAMGGFKITGVPPGTYTLVAWHEGYKIVRMDVNRPSYDQPHVVREQVEVKPQAPLTLNFTFPFGR